MSLLQEPDVVAERHILRIMAVGIVLTAAGVLVAWGIERTRSTELGQPPAAGMGTPPYPQEINGMKMSLFADRPTKPPPQRPAARALRSYGWVNRDEGIVHIPVDRAIDLYLSRIEAGMSP